MSVSASIPPTIQIRRSRLIGLIGGAAAVAAAVTWAALAFDVGGRSAQPIAPAQPAVVSSPIPMTGYLDGITSKPSVVAQATASDTYVQSIGALAQLQQEAAAREATGRQPQSRSSVRSIMDLTPGDLSGGGVWGYALPSAGNGPTTQEVLASLSPESRRHVEALMSLTFRQLAAGAAGSP